MYSSAAVYSRALIIIGNFLSLSDNRYENKLFNSFNMSDTEIDEILSLLRLPIDFVYLAVFAKPEISLFTLAEFQLFTNSKAKYEWKEMKSEKNVRESFSKIKRSIKSFLYIFPLLRKGFPTD